MQPSEGCHLKPESGNTCPESRLNGHQLLCNHTEHLYTDAVELVKARPCTALRQSCSPNMAFLACITVQQPWQDHPAIVPGTGVDMLGSCLLQRTGTTTGQKQLLLVLTPAVQFSTVSRRVQQLGILLSCIQWCRSLTREELGHELVVQVFPTVEDYTLQA